MKNIKLMSAVCGAVLAATAASGSYAATYDTTIFTESFEFPEVEKSRNWDVYNSVGEDSAGERLSWIKGDGDAGIELQQDSRVVTSYDGRQHVELDSHSNSSMSRTLDLLAGEYELSWWYRPRTSNTDTNGIGVSVFQSGVAGPLLWDTTVSSDTTKWQQVTNTFSLTQFATYTITFEATGTSDSFGGFVDYVTLSGPFQDQGRFGEVPLPAAAWLFLSAIGAGGLLRRAKGQR